MSSEGFFHRWSRLKSAGGATALPAQQDARLDTPADKPGTSRIVEPAPMPPAPVPTLPTLQDAARLTSESDYSSYVAQGVDKAVQRLAMKKLFSDPHFNIMDGLDIYIGDYNRSDPVPAAMLASLQHAQGFMRRAAALAEERQNAALASSSGPAMPVPSDTDAAAAESRIDIAKSQPAPVVAHAANQDEAAQDGSQPPSEGRV